MANCQNNMRYGRQMNFNNGRNAMPAGGSNNGCRNMPENKNSECRNMPVNNNNGCGNMPARDNNSGCSNMPARSNNSGCGSMPARSNNNSGCGNMPARSNNAGCPAPMPKQNCQNRTPEPCGCTKPQPCNNDCMSKPGNSMEARTPECGMPKHHTSEPCKCRHDALEDFPLAMAYVPWQKWQDIFEPCKAFQCGTIFEELSKPFRGRGGCNR